MPRRKKLPKGCWLRDFSSAKEFRSVLVERPERVNGLSKKERERLIRLSDEELEREMDAHLDLTVFLLQ